MTDRLDRWDGYAKRSADGRPRVILDLMECENGVFRMDGSLESYEKELPGGLKILVNGKKYAYVTKPGVVRRGCVPGAEAKTGGTEDTDLQECSTVVKRASFALEIPVSELCRKNTVRFRLEKASGQEQELSIVTSDYQAKLTSALRYSWWSFSAFMAVFSWKDREATGIMIEKTGRAARMAREMRLLKEILTAPYGSRQMFVVRCVYWLAAPVCSGKNIWLTFDKLYKGGDCGEYFYKYLEDHRPAGVVPVYVIRKDSGDYARLVREGYHPSPYRTVGQRLSYLYASMVFATHSGVPSFGGFNKWEIRYVQDRLRAVNTCIQHGLSVQDLTYDSNRLVNNNKRYYCASGYEIENLSKPSYDYGKDVLRLTGIPRYDGLVNRDKKQILIAPTWRSYVAMPSVMGSSRAYNPEFVHTEYYRIYQGLLENRMLRETAQRCGYRILYLLHPALDAQKKDFHGDDAVKIASSLEISYEQALTESSLMVTDYSGVQFDFAYMRKPVVYFHSPGLPPHYEEGGFFYDTQGFGEICTQEDELVQTICDYMESGCALKPFYRARQDDFFAFDDHENCRRICEDAFAFQKEHGVRKRSEDSD